MKTLFLLLLLALSASAHSQISPGRAARFQHLLDSTCSRLKIKGAQAAVVLPGVGMWQGASGSSHAGVAMDTTMQLALNSNTKTYIAALLLKLQEQSLLSLNDTIGTWFPGAVNVPGTVTIRQLLNHTSGLGDYTLNNAFWDSLNADYYRVWMPEEMMDFIPAPTAAPGGVWDYSNTNYLLAGLIAEAVTGQSLSAALRTHILQPLGLSKTFFWAEEQPSATVPHAWALLAPNTPQEDLDATGWYSHNAFYSAAHGAGALFGTAGDNARFWRALFSGQILSAQSLAQLRQTVSLGGNARYGLGVFRYTGFFGGRTVWTHGGTGIGFINDNAVDSATGICVTVLTNQDSIDNNYIFLSVVGALMRDAIADPTGLQDPARLANAVVYPVPASDVLHVRSDAQLAVLDLLDATGRTVLRGSATGVHSTLSVRDVPNGLYILRGYTADGLLALRQSVQIVR